MKYFEENILMSKYILKVKENESHSWIARKLDSSEI